VESAVTPQRNDEIGGKSRRRSIARPVPRGQSQWQIVPIIQKSGKLAQRFDLHHFG
jgi:hypothetical protein